MIRRVRDGAELDAALALREEVFCREQGVRLEADRDGLDGAAIQIVAVEDGAVVGTCRVVLEEATGRFGRLCVRRDARRRGLAAEMLAAAESEAVAAGARNMILHAQTDALALYRRAGYSGSGEPFDEEGIKHLRMSRALI